MSVDLYQEIEKKMGQGSGWKGVGSLKLASSTERMFELKRQVTIAKSFGLPMEMITAKEAQEKFPLMSTDGVEGAVWLPSDGYADPTTLTNALAKSARANGVEINLHTRVIGIEKTGRRVTAVKTDKGDVKCDIFVNCAGIWAPELGAMMGVYVPCASMLHQFLITEDMPDMPDDLPVMRDPDLLLYYKQEVKGLAIGGFETNPPQWAYDGIPKGFDQDLLPEDYDQFEVISTNAMRRTPCVETAGARKLINGPIPGSPDGNYVMGKVPEMDNVFVSTGYTYGIAAGGGAGRMIAEWIVDGKPSLDLWPEDIRRFGDAHHSKKYVFDRSQEFFGHYYLIHYPTEELETARGMRRSPVYEKLKGMGACYGSKFGWERPNWFAPEGVEPINENTWLTPTSFEHVGAECKATREAVTLFDQSSFGKFEVRGKGAADFLNRLSVSNVDKPVGKLIYTQWCNKDGGIEADLTIVRMAEDHYYVVTGSALTTHDMDWMRRHLPEDGSVVLADTTSSRAVINVQGPNARKLLEKVCEDDISHEGFPFGTAKQIFIGYAPALALRITYVGELGWELHIPTEYAAYVYETLWEAGQDLGIKNAGYLAIDSMRLEKGYRYWSADITADYNLYEAGLGFTIHWKSGGDFNGRDALAKIKAEGPTRVLTCFTMDEQLNLFGSETISHNGKLLAAVTSGGYGHTIGKSIVYAYIPVEDAGHTDGYVLTSFNEDHAATRHEGTLYDPKREKILR